MPTLPANTRPSPRPDTLASAKTLLSRRDGDESEAGASYLEIVDFISVPAHARKPT